MLERIRQKISPTKEEHIEFVADDTFENYIRDGRIPDFWDAGNKVVVFLPPEGVKPGDECESIHGGKIEYFHPNGGPSKGLASIHEVSLKRASRLKQIKNEVLQELGLITS